VGAGPAAMTGAVIVHVTAYSDEEAALIARTVVAERLAACANIDAPCRSFYRWQGRMEDAHEVPLTLKTRAALFARLSARICELHSYDCPCVIAVPVTDGARAYLDWIEAETAGRPDPEIK